MKRLLFLLIMAPICVWAQIDIRIEEVKYTPVYKPEVYDSLQSFKNEKKETLAEFRDQFKKYIGQDIYFIPYPNKNDSQMKGTSFALSQETGFKFYCPNKYHKFLVGQHEDQIQEVKRNKVSVRKEMVYYYDSTTVYKAIYLGNPNEIRWGSNVKIEPQYYCTPYSAYLGKYFKILDINVSDNSSRNIDLILLNDNNDTVVFSSHGNGDIMSFESKYPEFMLVGWYLKMKELYEGKDFIYFGNKNQYTGDDPKTTIDIVTGEKITLNRGSEWSCTGLQLMNVKEYSSLQLYLVFQNKTGNQIKVRIKERRDDKDPITLSRFYEKEEYLKMKEEERLSAEEKERKLAEEEAARIREKEKFEKTMIAKYGEKYGQLIIKGYVVIGMDKEMCRYAWGNPCEINTTTFANHIHEQWVYSLRRYLYFDDGILTAIQN